MNKNLSEKFADFEDARLWAQVVAFGPIMFQMARSLRNLGILNFIARHPSPQGPTLQDMMDGLDLKEYSLSVLLDGGESCGLVTNTEGHFLLTHAGKFIENDRLTEINMNFINDVCYKGAASLEDSLRTGRPEGLKVFGDWATLYEGLTQLPPQTLKSWFAFDHYFSDDAYPRVLPIIFQDKPARVLEIGCNTGKFAMAATKFREDFEMTLVDHPEQLELARENLDAQGTGHRITTVPMDVLKHDLAFPPGHDMVWMSQFLDCFGKEDIQEIVRRAAAAMTDDGTLYIMETFIDRQRYAASRFCLDMTSLYFTCIANGNSRMYRATDFHELLDKAGLKVIDETNNIRLSHTLMKIKKK